METKPTSKKPPNNYQLSVLLLKMDGKLDAIQKTGNASKTWQEKHEKEDTRRFEQIHGRITNLKVYGGSIAIVAAAIGLIVSQAWDVLSTLF